METIQDTIEFKFVDEGIKTSFSSTEEALEYVKKKKLLPRNGHSWRIEEIHHKVISHTFESERQAVDNAEITKKIIDYFLEHTTIGNVQFDGRPQYFNNPEHRNFRYHDQLYAYICCKQYLGYSIDQFVELYKRLWDANCDGNRYAFFGDICDLCCYYAMKDKYGIKEEDICLVKDPKFPNIKNMNPALEKNEAARREVIDWTHEMYMADGGHFTIGEHGSIKEEPKIWSDEMDYDPKDDFNYWEDASGTFVDDIVDLLCRETRNCAVAGWMTEYSFEATEELIPDKMFELMRNRNSKHTIPWKKGSHKLEMWEFMDKTDGIVVYKVLKFEKLNNKNGTDFCEYWYMIAID